MSRETVGRETRTGDLTVTGALSAGSVSNPTISGVATFAAGTVTAPAITTTGDTNTGIYFPAGDNVGIATAGTARVVIGSAGQITAVLGAVGSPTYSFTGDTNTGAYSPSADNYSIATAGTQRVNVDANGLITGTGSLGAWTTYTPTLGGTGWAIGNGTASGFYCQIGKVMFIRVNIVFGNTSTFGAGGITCSLPANANGSFPAAASGVVRYVDSSASAIYAGHGGIASNTFNFQYFNTNGSGQLSTVTSTSAPFTWADTDIIRLTMAYEIA